MYLRSDAYFNLFQPMSDDWRKIDDGGKKRDALSFSMANYGVDIVEMDATNVYNDWKQTGNEEMNAANAKSEPNRR